MGASVMGGSVMGGSVMGGVIKSDMCYGIHICVVVCCFLIIYRGPPWNDGW